MINNHFTSNWQISIERRSEDKLVMWISSDYSKSSRKSRLYVNAKNMAADVEQFWKSIKTKKMLGLSVSFGEQDYYDNMTDMYDVPYFTIKRGLRKAKIGQSEHGCIPKEWSFDLSIEFADMSTSTPILEVIKLALGYKFTAANEKKFMKELKPLLQKKVKYANASAE